MTKDQVFDFSRAIKELEEINRWFQSEEINLDEGLSKFRKGLSLIKKCRERLKEVENEFTEIKKNSPMKKKVMKNRKNESNPLLSLVNFPLVLTLLPKQGFIIYEVRLD